MEELQRKKPPHPNPPPSMGRENALDLGRIFLKRHTISAMENGFFVILNE
jgi:hypothetical protein